MKQFFSKRKFNSTHSYFSTLYPYFINLLHTIIKTLLIPKITSQNTKDASQFLKKVNLRRNYYDLINVSPAFSGNKSIFLG